MTGKSSSWSRKVRVGAGAAVVVLVTSAGILTLRAQTTAGMPAASTPLGTVLAGVQQIIAILSEKVVPALDPEPGPVVLSTGVASVRAGDLVWCSLTNVGDTPLGEVKHSIIQADGTLFATGGTGSLLPGRTAAGGAGGPAIFGRCEFEFDGLADEVRATMFIVAPDGATVTVLDAR